MCKITKELETPIVATGYKLAVKVGNKFYSPCTGLEYKVGMRFPNMKKSRKYIDDKWSGWNTINFEERMQGNTGIIESFHGLMDLYLELNKSFDYVILKMTLDNVKYEGCLQVTKTFIGNGLSAMEVVATLESNSWSCSTDRIRMVNNPNN